MIILILFLQNDNSNNLILSSLAVGTVCVCIVLSHLVFSKAVSPGCRLTLESCGDIFPHSPLSCYDVINDFELRINREGAEERERKKETPHCTMLLFLYIVYFMVMEGLPFKQKYLLIVIKGTT